MRKTVRDHVAGERRRPRLHRLTQAAIAVTIAARIVLGAAGVDSNFLIPGDCGLRTCSYPRMAQFVVARHEAAMSHASANPDVRHATSARTPPQRQPCFQPVVSTPNRGAAWPNVDQALLAIPMSHGWVNRELLDETRELWSRRYGRSLTDEDGLAILHNLRQYALALLRLDNQQESPA